MQVMEFTVLDLNYTEEGDWGRLLTKAHIEAGMIGMPWTLAGFLPVNASKAKAILVRERKMSDSEVTAVLNPPAEAEAPAAQAAQSG